MPKNKKYIAFVCTGNTCRSPMAEGIFNKLAEEKQIDVTAESFGLMAQSGTSVSQNSVEVCKEIGVDLSKLSSSSINDVNIDKYEKFYCMSQGHASVLSLTCDIPPEKMKVLNIADPYGGNIDIYRECRKQIYDAVCEIIEEYEN